MSRTTYVVRIVVDDENHGNSLQGDDFTLTHSYEGVRIVAATVDRVTSWDSPFVKALAQRDAENLDDVCLTCFGNLDHPTFDGYPENRRDCHRGFGVSPEQGILT